VNGRQVGGLKAKNYCRVFKGWDGNESVLHVLVDRGYGMELLCMSMFLLYEVRGLPPDSPLHLVEHLTMLLIT